MHKPISYLLLTIAVSLVFAAGASARSYPFDEGELAPPEGCPGQTAVGLTVEEELGVMLCMTNYARATHGLRGLTRSRELGLAAGQKSADILECGEFSHEACGRPFVFWDQRYGYLVGCWRAAENIAWGVGTESTVRSIFRAWLESPEHHANILGPYREVGIGLRVGGLEGYEDAAVWTQDFGSHKC